MTDRHIIEQVNKEIRLLLNQIQDGEAEIERLRAEVGEWRSAACINPERNWPHFEGWDKSQLARCFMKYVGGPREDWADHVKAYAALQGGESDD
jgi:hypothetical protein